MKNLNITIKSVFLLLLVIFNSCSSSDDSIVDDTEEPDPFNRRMYGEDYTERYPQTSENSVDAEYCPYCGGRIADDFEYCPKCGKKLPF